ncbi:hypothetical protein D4R78_08360, partial [bacterium]
WGWEKVFESRLLKAAARLSSKAVWAKPVCSKRKQKQMAREMSLKVLLFFNSDIRLFSLSAN